MKPFSEFKTIDDFKKIKNSDISDYTNRFIQRTNMAFQAIGKTKKYILQKDREFAQCIKRNFTQKGWGSSPSTLKNCLTGAEFFFGHTITEKNKERAGDFFQAILDYLNAHDKLNFFLMPEPPFDQNKFEKIIEDCWFAKYGLSHELIQDYNKLPAHCKEAVRVHIKSYSMSIFASFSALFAKTKSAIASAGGVKLFTAILIVPTLYVAVQYFDDHNDQKPIPEVAQVSQDNNPDTKHEPQPDKSGVKKKTTVKKPPNKPVRSKTLPLKHSEQKDANDQNDKTEEPVPLNDENLKIDQYRQLLHSLLNDKYESGTDLVVDKGEIQDAFPGKDFINYLYAAFEKKIKENTLDEAFVDGGLIYFVINKKEQALSYFKESLKSDPENYRALSYMGIYYELEKKNDPKAQEYFDKASALVSDTNTFTEEKTMLQKAIDLWEDEHEDESVNIIAHILATCSNNKYYIPNLLLKKKCPASEMPMAPRPVLRLE